MSYYSKPQIDLLYNLINESNPGLLEPRDLVNTRLGLPFNRTPAAGEIADTSLELYATPESFYIGKQIVHYRRIDVSRLFANMTIKIDRWTPSGSIDRTILREQINQLFGLTLVDDDLPNTTWGGTTYNVDILPTSLTYKGRFRFTYTRGKRALDQILPANVETFQSRFWDSRYVEGKPLLSLVNVGLDFSAYGAVAGNISNNWTINGSDFRLNQLIGWYRQVSGIMLDANKPHTEVGGIGGLVFTRFSLPNINAPEGNTNRFNRVILISSRDDSWFAGKIIMHYNV